MTLYRLTSLFGLVLFAMSGALAQDTQMVTANVVSVAGSGAAYIVELDEQNTCGSYMYVANNVDIIEEVQLVVNEAREFGSGAVTLTVQGCASGSAVIIGATGAI